MRIYPKFKTVMIFSLILSSRQCFRELIPYHLVFPILYFPLVFPFPIFPLVFPFPIFPSFSHSLFVFPFPIFPSFSHSLFSPRFPIPYFPLVFPFPIFPSFSHQTAVLYKFRYRNQSQSLIPQSIIIIITKLLIEYNTNINTTEVTLKI